MYLSQLHILRFGSHSSRCSNCRNLHASLLDGYSIRDKFGIFCCKAIWWLRKNNSIHFTSYHAEWSLDRGNASTSLYLYYVYPRSNHFCCYSSALLRYSSGIHLCKEWLLSAKDLDSNKHHHRSHRCRIMHSSFTFLWLVQDLYRYIYFSLGILCFLDDLCWFWTIFRSR